MIGVFDSGVGGLTVVKEILNFLPQYEICYFGDLARSPYGSKGKETIIKYAFQDTEFLLSKGAKIIIIACNTVSAVAYPLLKKSFSLPIFEVITPAAQKAIEATRNKRVGVIGTRATINSRFYEDLLSKDNLKVYSESCPLLVPLIEEDWIKKPETKSIIKKYLYPLKLKEIDTLVLACTHYPLLKDLIRERMGKKVFLVDSAEETAKEVKDYLSQNPLLEKSLIKSKDHRFFVSDFTEQFQKTAEKILGKKIKLKKADICF